MRRIVGGILIGVSCASTAFAGNIVTFNEVARLDKPPGAEFGRAIAFLNGRMFFGKNRTIYELDPANGSVLATFDPGVSAIIGMAGDDGSGRLYVSECCGSTLQIVDPDLEAIVGSVTVGTANLQGLAIDGDRLYGSSNVSGNEGDQVFEFDLTTGATLRSFDVGPFVNQRNVQGVEVFLGTVFVNVDDGHTAPGALELHEFSLSDFAHQGIGYTGVRAAGSAFDGQFFWLDEQFTSPGRLIKFQPVPEPARSSLLLAALSTCALLGRARSSRRGRA